MYYLKVGSLALVWTVVTAVYTLTWMAGSFQPIVFVDPVDLFFCLCVALAVAVVWVPLLYGRFKSRTMTCAENWSCWLLCRLCRFQ